MNSRTLAIVGIGAIALAVVFCASVMAGGTNPAGWLNTIIMNNASNPVPTNVLNKLQIDSLNPVNVTVKNTVPVTVQNTHIDVEGTVTVDDSTPINVNVTNPVDVSGWLHTTVVGQETYANVPNVGGAVTLSEINTTGYREITFRIWSYQDGFECAIYYHTGDSTWGYGAYWENLVNEGVFNFGIEHTLPVISESITILVINNGAGPADCTVDYYMTT